MALTTTEEALVRQLLDQQAAILSLAGNESTITSKLGATKVTLSDLVSASAINDADLMLLRQGVTDKTVSGAILKALAALPDVGTAGTFNKVTTDVKGRVSSGQDINYFRKNTVLNGDGRVRQGIAVNISATRQYGLADGWLMSVSAGTPSAGTVTADNIALGVNKSQAKSAGVTCTGAGVVDFATRIAGEDAILYGGKTVMVSALVQHDVGSNINWSVALRKANSLDNFSAVTGIAASGAFSVPTATGTRIFVPATLGASDGDNGLEILIQASCGAVTTKNFWVTETQIEVGSGVTEFENLPFEQVLAICRRQYWRARTDNYGAGYSGVSNVSLVAFQGPPMRGIPALVYSALSDFSLQSGNTSGVLSAMTVASINNGMYSLQVTTSTAITAGNVAFLRSAVAASPWIAFDSRL